MYKKYFLHFTMVSLKFFFDFDHNSCKQLFYSALLVICLLKWALHNIGATFYDGLLTVKYDVASFREEWNTLIERWKNSQLRENAPGNIRIVKTNLLEDTRNWRLKISK